MFITGWNKEEGNRTFLNYYIVAPFSNDQKAKENRFKYLAGSFGIAACTLIAGFGPISLIYQLGVAALIMKEWYTTLPKDRVIQKISLDSSCESELDEAPDLESGYSEFLKRVDGLEKVIEELKEKLYLSTDNSETLKKQIANLNGLLGILKEENTEALTTIQSKDKQIKELEEKKQAPQKDNQKEIEVLNGIIQVKDSTIQEQNLKIKEQNLKIKEQDINISTYTSQAEINKNMIETYKKQTRELSSDLDKKDSQQQENLEKIEKQESEISRLKNQIKFNQKDNETKILTYEKKIESLEKKVKEVEGFLESAENDKIKLESDSTKQINDLKNKHLEEKQELILRMRNPGQIIEELK